MSGKKYANALKQFDRDRFYGPAEAVGGPHRLLGLPARHAQPDEEDALATEERVAGHAELLHERSAFLYRTLYEQESAVADLLSSCCKELEKLSEIDTAT